MIATGSRASLFGLLLSISISFIFVYLVPFLYEKKIKKQFLNKTIISITIILFFYNLVIENYISQYIRFQKFFALDSFFIRITNITKSLEYFSDNLFMTFFGFAINTGASEKAAFSLYTTDSSLAFIISHLGILGLIILFLLTFYLIRLIIPLKFFTGILQKILQNTTIFFAIYLLYIT